MSKRLLIFLVVLAVGAIAAAFVAKQQGWIGKKILTKVATEKAQRRIIVETVSGSGKIYPEIEVALAPDASGELTELLVEEGDSVRKGQLLARINPDIYKSMVERADAAVNSARSSQANASGNIDQISAQIGQVEVQIANARRLNERNQQLLKDGVISQMEADNSETSLRALEQQLRGLQASKNASNKGVEGAGYNVKSAQATLKEARDNLNRTNIYAPMNGIVSKLNVEKGERVVGTSQFSGTEIMRIADMKTMEVQADISENDIVRVSLRDTAYIEVDAYTGRKFKGIVTQIANSAKTGTQLTGDQITNFIVKIRLLQESYADLLKDRTFPFRPGMSATVDIETHKIAQALSVPIQAVTVRLPDDSLTTEKPKAEQEQELVFVYRDGRVYQTPVTVGIQDETYIQILSGVAENVEVVSAPYRTIAKTLKDSLEVERVSKEDLYKKKESGFMVKTN